MRSKTRFNSKDKPDKLIGYFLEKSSGYGVKPLLVLRNILIVFLLFSIIFILNFNFFDAVLLSAGAFFTFGAQSELLKGHSLLEFIYIVEAFFGICSIAFFITVLYNYWFGKDNQ